MSATDTAANEIILRLRELPTPRDAARTMAIVHAQLCIQAGGMTEKKVREQLEESRQATLDAWSQFVGTPLKS